ncbi:MAG: DUF4139 domain-containing protein [Terracidiphilus sp.]|nr:DUF4139 domain-containing protein [Terracidiphilus sp.]
MRLVLAAVCCVVILSPLAAQTTASAKAHATPAVAVHDAAPPPVAKDLPVRKVVLYKNGVGYFEHAGTVTGNQKVAIDFTSPQLNDVLQSLTVLDLGGGRIAGVNYNSTTPLAEQLKTLALGMSDDPTSTELFQALRGQRVEVTGAPGGAIAGRLMSIESRTVKAGGSDATGDSNATMDKFFLTIVAASGAVRVVELTPALSVRPVDASLQGQLDRYLALLATAHANGLRHLTLDALGQGTRELRVSYISEVPVWKATYRIVFGRDATAKATVQGWAVVDNTVGADWENVQLSLVAGAPQSFIQPLSQPLYMRRPEVPIAVAAESTPQTHEAAEVINQQQIASTPLASPQRMDLKNRNFAQMAKIAPESASETVEIDAEGEGSGVAHGSLFGVAGRGGSGVYRASDAIREGDVSTNAFDDFFEYALAQPVTIRKNESAMVPILQQELPVERVTLWNERETRPLRAVWLENTSKLTLDTGSFSIFESGTFAGEGLLDPIHPGEKRLLSYATDQAVKVHRDGLAQTGTITRIALHQGVLVETLSQVAESNYTVANASDEARTVVVEHSRMSGGELVSDTKPAETTANAYRFRVPVDAHGTVSLKVREHVTRAETVVLNPDLDRTAFLIQVSKYTPELEQKLSPIIDATTALNDIKRKLAENAQRQKTLTDDEARMRENVTALKGNDAAKRFVEQLNRAEDDLMAARKEQADLERERDAARAKLAALIAQASFETDLNVVTGGNQLGEVR